jgi:hypothetical protein
MSKRGAAKKRVLAAATLFLIAFSGAAAGVQSAPGRLAPIDPVALYGDEHRFRVLRDGATVGRHVVRFAAVENGWSVEARLELRVAFLGLTLYRLDYRSLALWDAGGLRSLAVEVAENGDETIIAARRDGGGLIVSGPSGEARASLLFPTDHWHPGVREESQVLNTLNGDIAAVTIQPGAWQTLSTVGGRIVARPYVYSGDVSTTVWYDRVGRWVGMRFAGRDGSTIEYVCETCAPADGSPVASE